MLARSTVVLPRLLTAHAVASQNWPTACQDLRIGPRRGYASNPFRPLRASLNN